MPKGKVLAKKANERNTLYKRTPSSIEGKGLFIVNYEEKKRSAYKEETCEAISDQENAELESNEEPNSNIGNEMSNMLGMFESDLNKNMLAKKRRLELFTNAAIDIHQSKLMNAWNTQNTLKKCLLEEFATSANKILKQCEADIIRQKEQEEKVKRILRQHAEVVDQTRTVHLQMISSIRKIKESLENTFQNLEKKDMEQIESMKEEIRQEILLLQKRTLLKSQQQHMKNVRKSLQNIFTAGPY